VGGSHGLRVGGQTAPQETAPHQGAVVERSDELGGVVLETLVERVTGS